MKALVLGATGIVGANIVRALKKRNLDVRALVRTTSDTSAIDGTRVKKLYGDILDPSSLRKAMRGRDVIFHCAAIFSYSGRSEDEMFITAAKGTENVIREAASAGVRRIVLTASSVVLGSSQMPRVIDEEHPGSEAPASSYEKSKIEQLRIAKACADECEMEIVYACPTLCVGPYDRRLTEGNAVITNYMHDPFHSTWDGGVNIVSVTDVAEGHILLAQKGTPGECYLLGADNISWEGLHRVIAELSGVHPPLLHANHTSTCLAAVAYELSSLISGDRPLVSRSQAKMVGRYYWYASGRAGELGYRPVSSRCALSSAIAWLSASDHVTPSLRSRLRMSDEVLQAGLFKKE